MGQREMGRHWSSEEERQVSTLRSIEREQKEISKMRPTCKSHTDDKKSQKASAVKRKRAAGNPGGKPTNVKTFAKK
jgi:hypothetical protein